MTSTVSDRVRNWAIGLRMTSKYPVHQLPPPPPRTREPAIPFCWTRLWRLGTTDSCAVLKPDSHLPARYMGEKCLSDSVCEWEQSLMCGPCLPHVYTWKIKYGSCAKYDKLSQTSQKRQSDGCVKNYRNYVKKRQWCQKSSETFTKRHRQFHAKRCGCFSNS